MHLVNKYELGSPAGYGAMIDQRDVADLARAVYAIPDYHDSRSVPLLQPALGTMQARYFIL
jgi:hypothetical protein